MSEAPTTTVANVPDHLTLVDTDYEVREILDHLDYDDRGAFGILFVDTEDGEYTEVWAVRGSVPWLHKTAYQLRPLVGEEA